MGSRDSYDEKSDIKSGVNVATTEANLRHRAFNKNQADAGAQLVAGLQADVDPAESVRIRKKIDWHILPLMCSEFFQIRCFACDIQPTTLQCFTGFNLWIRLRWGALLSSVSSKVISVLL